MSNALRTLKFEKFAATALSGITGIMFVLLLGSIAQADPAELDDGWRRTRFGWENIRDWDLPAEFREPSSATPLAPAILSPAADAALQLLHPCVIALGLGLVMIATLHLARPPVSIDLPPGNAV